LLRGVSGRAYNVGSDESVSIYDLAKRVCNVLSREPNLVLLQPQSDVIAPHYVPDISRASKELGLQPPMPLDEAIFRTADFHTRTPC